VAARVRIVLIEDNEVFREALRLLLTLDGDIEIAGEEANGSLAVELCRRVSPDVALVDYRLPGLDGVEVTRALRRDCPETSVVALTAAAGDREMQAMLEAGAAACVRKDEPLEKIARAVREAA
jgi:DNA-binding NarL/FixJ family response regulator